MNGKYRALLLIITGTNNQRILIGLQLSKNEAPISGFKITYDSNIIICVENEDNLFNRWKVTKHTSGEFYKNFLNSVEWNFLQDIFLKSDKAALNLSLRTIDDL